MISNASKLPIGLALTLGLALLPGLSQAFDSGSTGSDGAFNPTEDTELQLPPDGVFNFTTVNIPTGVTLTFKKNVTNTPVYMLASGDVTIAGTIDVRGSNSADVGTSGDGNLVDDGTPGQGGPGGFDGGFGGVSNRGIGGYGQGPGGGNDFALSGGTTSPLIGGSGGGGAPGGNLFPGVGGGGGGGAILIASTARISFTNTGVIDIRNGGSGTPDSLEAGVEGGQGSPGAVRIMATALTVTGNTIVLAHNDFSTVNGAVSIETESLIGNIYIDIIEEPYYSLSSTPSDVFSAGLPKLSITSVAGVTAPTSPSGDADIVLPETLTNPVAINFASTGVPVGSTVSLKLTPRTGAAPATVISSPLSGSESSATASASIDIPDGSSTLFATVIYNVEVAMQGDYKQYTNGEQVAQIRLDASPSGQSLTTFITPQGKEYTVPSNQLASN